MTPLFLYLLKVNIALTLFYLAYRYGLRRLTFYTLNRFFLLFAIVFSSTYPLISLEGYISSHSGAGQLVQYLPDLESLAPENPIQNSSNAIDLSADSPDFASWPALWDLLAVIFWVGVALTAGRFLGQLVSLALIHRTSSRAQASSRMEIGTLNLRIVNEKINPFSFFSCIYINPELHSPEEQASILAHERVHVRQWHTADILAGELNRIFYWFNPGAWLLMTAIRENLEFITDRKVLQSGVDPKAYQYNLVRASKIPPYTSALANNFNFSHLKIRITMMDKKPSSELHLVKYLVLTPFITLIVLTFNVSRAEPQRSGEEIATSLLSPGNALPERTKAPILSAGETTAAETTTRKNEYSTVRFRPPVIKAGIDATETQVRIHQDESRQLIPDTSRTPLIIIDGEKADYKKMEALPPGEIYSIEHGEKAKSGVFIITTKKGRIKRLQDHIAETRKSELLRLDSMLQKMQAGVNMKERRPTYGIFGERPELLGSANSFIQDVDLGTKVDWEDALLVIDGKIAKDKKANDLDHEHIESISVLKGGPAFLKYGEKGKNGVIEIFTKTE